MTLRPIILLFWTSPINTLELPSLFVISLWSWEICVKCCPILSTSLEIAELLSPFWVSLAKNIYYITTCVPFLWGFISRLGVDSAVSGFQQTPTQARLFFLQWNCYSFRRWLLSSSKNPSVSDHFQPARRASRTLCRSHYWSVWVRWFQPDWVECHW